jgi:anti-anti-sigma factor
LSADARRPRKFEVRREDTDTVPVIAVVGELDVATVDEVRAQLASVPADSCPVVDLCETSFMDSSGLHVLLKEHSRRDGRLHVACTPAGPVTRLLRTAGVGPALHVHDSRDEALAAAAAAGRA